MSTNTTNTHNGAGRPKPEAPGSDQRPTPGAQEVRFPFATFPMPDPATLERLANEFFLVMPSHLGNGDTPSAPEVSAEAVPDAIPTTLFTEEMIPPSGAHGVESFPDIPSSFPSSPPGPLTEADLRAIAATLGNVTSLSGVPATGTTPAVPSAGSPQDASSLQTISPFGMSPNLPTENGIFSFPAVPGPFSSPPTGLPAGADVGAALQSTADQQPTAAGSVPYVPQSQEGATPANPSVLPNDLFSFPRIPSLPNVSALPTVAPPADSPEAPFVSSPEIVRGASNANIAPAPAQSAIPPIAPQTTSPPPHDVKSVPPSVPQAPAENSSSRAVWPASSEPVSADQIKDRSAYSGSAASLPSGSELFSFPGVPGAQSPPGLPNFSSSLSSSPTQEMPSLPRAQGGQAGFRESAPEISAPSTRSASTYPSFEFRPDLVPDLGVSKRPLDPRLIRRDFPILEERVNGKQLIWLDNAATTQKPNAVIDRLSYFYRHENSNIHRAAHALAARATDAYESAREKTRRFLNASTTKEIVFVRGTTEGINLIAQSWGRRNVQKDDEIVITWLEHHANIVPWQQLCSEKGARLRVAPVNDRGEIILEEYEKLLGPRTRIVSFSQVSNALGTITPAREMVEIAHRYGACVVVDGAQAVSHMPVDVQALGCDFYVFSGHKVFGPTGIGAVYGKLDVLESMPPWQGGGNMIADVTFEKTVYQGAPARFEAGTGNIADAVGLGAALDYVEEVGMENIAAYEHELLNYGTSKLLSVPGLRLIGTAREKAGVLSFVLDDVRTEDVGVALNHEGIAVRSGHHCAQPILRRMGVESTVRPSLAFYNIPEELDQLTDALLRIQAGRGHRQLGNNS